MPYQQNIYIVYLMCLVLVLLEDISNIDSKNEFDELFPEVEVEKELLPTILDRSFFATLQSNSTHIQGAYRIIPSIPIVLISR